MRSLEETLLRSYNIEVIDAPIVDISSTEIRDGLLAGKDMSEFLMWPRHTLFGQTISPTRIFLVTKIADGRNCLAYSGVVWKFPAISTWSGTFEYSEKKKYFCFLWRNLGFLSLFTFSNLQKNNLHHLKESFRSISFLISHVPPAHSFFENRSILENSLLIRSNLLFFMLLNRTCRFRGTHSFR